jgi:hypothetical protein
MDHLLPPRPIRLCLRRRKSFRLQDAGLRANGLRAIKVDRSTCWGNPFLIEVLGRKEAIDAFRRLVIGRMSDAEIRDHAGSGPGWQERSEPFKTLREVVFEHLRELCAKNVACWCKLDEECHGDVLLELAHRSDA